MGYDTVLRAISSTLTALKIFGIYSLEEERLRKLERDLPRLRAELGKIGLDEEVTALNEQGKNARERLSETIKKINEFDNAGRILGQLSPTNSLAIQMVRPAFAGINDLKSAESEYLEYLSWFNEVAYKMADHAEREFKNKKIGADELQAIYQTLIDAEGNGFKQTELRKRLSSLIGSYSEKKTKTDTDEQQQKQLAIQQRNISNSGTPSPEYASVVTSQSLFGEVGLGKPKLSKVSTTPPEQSTKQAKETFTELTVLSESFQNSFDAGMKAVGQSINQSLGAAFRGVFGEANSLLEIFIANFISSMTSNVLSLLTGGATNWLSDILGFAHGGIINEPIFGIGKSGQRYLFGEAGREAVIPFSEMAAAAQFMKQYPAPFKPGSVIAETKVSGSDLLVVLKYAGMRTGRTTF